MRCRVKSLIERNPYRVLEMSRETASVNGEEGGDDVKSVLPLCPGRHACYNGRYNALQCSDAELINKTGPSSD